MTPHDLFVLLVVASLVGLVAVCVAIMIIRRLGHGPVPDPRVYAVQVFSRTGERLTTSHIVGRWRKVSRMAARISAWPDVERVQLTPYQRSEDRMVLWVWKGGRAQGHRLGMTSTSTPTAERGGALNRTAAFIGS
ncbi:hypothetical protein FHU36_007844 [Nonomuraea muscovyensis]|uniref:Uncharacterized protein n=1 Tax=Nonomuraea muscovyensis TaxID=1124761 RepID=A0A7X0F331_9ACTN|nr:hypothetical protein [Nonomuraea muscovyensis]MBB6351261.1 hypothetical protein [Nonomuraea muscovyensis]